jgi:hypothetical protein
MKGKFMEIQPPKVFLSHASEDKERFVNLFAEKLIANGVNAWIDKWEMLPGDSLVDKIFEEGIKNAQAMIIVLSKYSVNKKWVREELNAGMVKKIDGATKLIPVVIDDCEVPEALKSTVWEKIKDINSYDEEFQRILASIFGTSLKPPIGTPPKYVQFQIDSLPDLNKIDTIVFKTICEKSLQSGIDMISTSEIIDQLQSLGITEETMYESTEVLNNKHLISGKPQYMDRIDFFKITTFGFETFAENFLPEFNDVIRKVLLLIVNENVNTDHNISSRLNRPRILIDYALDVLAKRGYLRLVVTNDTVNVSDVSVQGKRAARELAE